MYTAKYYCMCQKKQKKADNLQDLLALALKSSAIIMSVRSLTLSDKLLRFRPRLRPPSAVLCMMVCYALEGANSDGERFLSVHETFEFVSYMDVFSQ